MILSTTNTLETHKIGEYIGIVTGEVIVGVNAVKDIFASISDIFGGRTSAYEGTLRDARETAMSELEDKAKEMGADAVIGIDIDYETVRTGGMLMVSVTGTAVKFSHK